MRELRSKIWKATDVLAKLPAESDAPESYIEPFSKGATSLGLYAPKGEDHQEPHDQDELYFVISGSGTFVHDGRLSPFGPGDAIFVAAGVPHRFEDFSDDFSTWVLFWG